jgi:hypothetical protein
MALPSLSAPEFFTTIPSTGKEIKYRPFLVKEEKILLMALEGEDAKEINSAILKILKNCIIDDVDVNKLSTFDVEYLFLRLRGKSVGEKVELKVGHTKGDCTHQTEVEVDLDKVELVGEIKDGKIMLTDSIGLKIRYPSLSDVTANPNQDAADAMYDMIANCVEYIYDDEEVYGEFTKKELQDWIGGLNASQFKKITEFYEDMPKVSHEIKWVCPKCGEEDSIILEGLDSFFT